ncbi:MAG: SDR family oxidoreductase [Dehalococcoidia bacterium]
MTFNVALVTGATGGIGSAISEELRTSGFRLALLSRSISCHESESMLAQRCDVTKVDEVEKAVTATLKKFGNIDVVINCAGRSHLGTVDELTEQDIQAVYDVNVKGTINVCKAVLPCMKKQKSGYIINIGSLRGIEYGVGKSAYSMSKSAVIAFSNVLAMETAEYGIKVTVINPGFVQTSLIRHRIAEEKLRAEDLTQPGDIAKVVLFLLELSPGASIVELNIGRLW